MKLTTTKLNPVSVIWSTMPVSIERCRRDGFPYKVRATTTLAGLYDWNAAKHVRHSHGEQFDDDICVERFENVFGHQRFIDPGILVFVQFREIALANVDHGGRRK